MKITTKVAMEIMHHEGFVREAYKDSVGVWTWSFGLTNNSGHDVERYIDNPQTTERCIEVFLWALERYADDVLKAFRGVLLTEAQFAAALSFHWNTGAIARAAWVKHWKAGNAEAAKLTFMSWKKPAAIIPRRKAERDLFFNEVWAQDGTTLEYTMVAANKRPMAPVRTDVRESLKAAIEPKQPQRPARPIRLENPKPQKRSLWALLLSLFGGRK